MSRPKRIWKDSDTQTLIRMNAVGYTDGEIARVTGHAVITIRVRRTLLGVSPCRRKDWTKRTWKVAA